MLSDNLSPNTLRPIFSHALSLKLEIIKLEAFIQNYSTGQTLAGKVVQVLPEQKAVVELQGEKLLLQFPRPVNPGQNIAIKIEQVHPSPILKLTEFSSLTSSQKIAPGNLAKVGAPLNTPESDKTSIQYRSADSLSGTPVPGAENGQAAPDTKVTNPLTKAVLKARAPLDKRVTTAPLSKTDLKPLGIEGGQKVKAEVIRVVDRETVQVRFNDNAVTVKYAASQKLQPGEPIYLHAKPIPSGKFVLEVEQIPIPSVTVRPPLE
ncbi:MAG: hypothetical protein V3R23_04585, partial [Nitrospinaceae bacterium]